MADYRTPSPLAREAMAYVLAGGRGTRLYELTDRRAKPAVYFGGKSRIIDFALSQCAQFGHPPHLGGDAVSGAQPDPPPAARLELPAAPSETRVSTCCRQASACRETQWYEGTADAVYQNMDIIEDYGPRYIVLLAGDHIYKMDYEIMLRQHVDTGADVTIGCLEVPRMEATGFGVMHVDGRDRVIDFVEKPKDPPGIPDKPDLALASMGIYVFETRFLMEQLRRDAATEGSSRDFGKDIIPYIVKNGSAWAHRFPRSCVRSTNEEVAYWRDVGTIDAYWKANIDLTDVNPQLDLYDRDWPIWTYAEITPPAKFVHDFDGRRGSAVNSLVSGDCIVSGGALDRTLLSTGSRVHSYSELHEAVVLPYCTIGRGARLRKVVVDRGVNIPEGLVVGEDPEFDAKWFRRTEEGVTLITQPMIDKYLAGR